MSGPTWLNTEGLPAILRWLGINRSQRQTIDIVGPDVEVLDDEENDRSVLKIHEGSAPLANAGTGALHNVVSTASGVPVSGIRFSGVAPSVTGIASGSSGRRLLVIAVGGPLVLAHENVGSLAANRIVTSSAADVTLAQHGAAWLVYDLTAARWRIASAGGGGGDDTKIRGRAASAATPLLGQAYVWNGTAHVPAGRIFHVELFAPEGSLPDADFDGGGYDWADAIEAACAALNVYGGGIIQFGPTEFGSGYRVGRTVNLTQNVQMRGHGGRVNYPGTAIVADEGVTHFRLWYASTGPGPGDGAADSVITGFSLLWSGQLTTTTTGTYTQDSFDLPVDDPEDFLDGQLISLEGCGPLVALAEVTAETTNGSPIVTLTHTDGGGSPLTTAGHFLVIGTAYPTPTEVISTDGDELTMASNAATTLPASEVVTATPFYARLVSGAGTNAWVIDAHTPGVASFVGCKIRHADAGVDMLVRARIGPDVSIGDPFGHHPTGPAIAVRGDHGNVPATNANAGFLDYQAYKCRNAFYSAGVDSNVVTVRCISVQATDWSFLELGGLGNIFLGCHGDGGLGFLTPSGATNATVLLGCYVEAGSGCSLGSGTVCIGGNLPAFCGGTHLSGGFLNEIAIGQLPITRHLTRLRPKGEYINFQSSTGGNGGLSCVAEDPVTGGAPGFFQWIHKNAGKSHPIVIADTDQTDFRVGSLWLPTDFVFGEDRLNQNLDTSEGARMASYRSDIATGTGAVIYDPAAGRYENNAIIADPRAPYWKKGDWIRDANLLDGCPTRHVIEVGHRAPEWQPLHAYAQFILVCPTVNNHNGSFYMKQDAGVADLSGATEPDWNTAPNPGDTLTEGANTWVNAGAAAYTQPVDLGGYIVHEISGDETWTQTTRAFLCGAIEITGTLSEDAILTLPAGRYPRWLKNNTIGGFDIVIKCATGDTVRIPPGFAATVQCDGTQMCPRTDLVAQDPLLSGKVLTDDATPEYRVLATLAVGDVRQIDVIAKVAKADGTTRQCFKLSGLYYGAAGPTATEDTYSATPTGTGAADVLLEVDGATVRMKITGVAATDLVTTYEAHVI